MSDTVRLTVGQAVVRFLGQQWSERDGERQRLFAGCLGIFGHGNVAGVGQALLQEELAHEGREGDNPLPYVLARNEQAMVHTAVGYARQRDRLQTWVCTASVGPGSTNMLTGAALATINRIPVLLLPSGTFATRVSAPVLQELEQRLADAGHVPVAEDAPAAGEERRLDAVALDVLHLQEAHDRLRHRQPDAHRPSSFLPNGSRASTGWSAHVSRTQPCAGSSQIRQARSSPGPAITLR